MTAREDVLSAARSLLARGITPFSVAELIAEARGQGSTYPDSTLQTHIVSAMCINAPVNHAVVYRDLERVGRGRYRLVASGDRVADRRDKTQPPRPVRVEVEADNVSERNDEEPWSWEGHVQAKVVAHLASTGWQIRRVANTATSEHGIDIEADKDDIQLLVEVKGYPGSTYQRGERRGSPKSTSAPNQARMYFSHALLAGLIMRAEHPDARVVLAFPEMSTYINLAKRVGPPLGAAGIETWLVADDGTVRTGEERSKGTL